MTIPGTILKQDVPRDNLKKYLTDLSNEGKIAVSNFQKPTGNYIEHSKLGSENNKIAVIVQDFVKTAAAVDNRALKNKEVLWSTSPAKRHVIKDPSSYYAEWKRPTNDKPNEPRQATEADQSLPRNKKP